MVTLIKSKNWIKYPKRRAAWQGGVYVGFWSLTCANSWRKCFLVLYFLQSLTVDYPNLKYFIPPQPHFPEAWITTLPSAFPYVDQLSMKRSLGWSTERRGRNDCLEENFFHQLLNWEVRNQLQMWFHLFSITPLQFLEI